MEVTNHFIVYKLKLKLLFLKRLNCSNMQDLPLMILVFFYYKQIYCLTNIIITIFLREKGQVGSMCFTIQQNKTH